MSIGHHMDQDSLKNVKGLINDFHDVEFIEKFKIDLMDFIFSDKTRYTIYLSPVRRKDYPMLITGDNAFINFEGDIDGRLNYARQLKEKIIAEGYDCSMVLTGFDHKDSNRPRWQDNRIYIEEIK
jgi:hypothetical protein